MRIRHVAIILVIAALSGTVWLLTNDKALTAWNTLFLSTVALEIEILDVIRPLRSGERNLRSGSLDIVAENLDDVQRAQTVMLTITFGLAALTYLTLNGSIQSFSYAFGSLTILFGAGTATLPAWIYYLRNLRNVKRIYHPTIWWSIIQVASIAAMAILTSFIARRIGIDSVVDAILVMTPFVVSYFALYRLIRAQVWTLDISGPEASLLILKRISEDKSDARMEEAKEMLARINLIISLPLALENQFVATLEYVKERKQALSDFYSKYTRRTREMSIVRSQEIKSGKKIEILCDDDIYLASFVPQKKPVNLAVEVSPIDGSPIPPETKKKLTRTAAWIAVAQQFLVLYYVQSLLNRILLPLALLRRAVIGTMPALVRRNMGDWLSSNLVQKRKQFALQIDLDLTATEGYLLERIEKRLTSLYEEALLSLNALPSCEIATFVEESLLKLDEVLSQLESSWERRKKASQGLLEIGVSGSQFLTRTSDLQKQHYTKLREKLHLQKNSISGVANEISKG